MSSEKLTVNTEATVDSKRRALRMVEHFDEFYGL